MSIVGNFTASINGGIHYLKEHQFHNGQFPSYMYCTNFEHPFYLYESNTFTTGLIVQCLLEFKDNDVVRDMLDKADYFLIHQKMHYGLWQYLSRDNLAFPITPVDIDTTSIVSDYLTQRGKSDYFENLDSFRLFKNREGLFKTWIYSDLKMLFNEQTRRFLFRYYRRYFSAKKFYKQFHMGPNDVSMPINWNVLHYLGKCELTQPIINKTVELVNNNVDFNSFRWYRYNYISLYFLCRNFRHDIIEFEALKPVLINVILGNLSNGQFEDLNELAVSMYLSSLIRLNYSGPEIDELAFKIVSFQQANGSWKLCEVFGADFGEFLSESMTTVIAIESLSLYNKLKYKS